ncbi:MAG TPA: outer membrane beta-barrel protein [Geobacteraceae bacterium]|nr:outer membrane beta-barrel protein [Geobacteraceae bacterium]
MKRIVLALLMVLAFASAALADGFYIGAAGGVNFIQDSTVRNPDVSSDSLEASFDPGYLFDAVAGYRWQMLRFEGEFIYQKSDLDSISSPESTFPRDGDATGIGGMANAWIDLATESIVTVYIGGGLGFMNVKLSNSTVSINDSVFAWQVGAGVGFALTKKLSLDLGYRLLVTSDLEYNNGKAEYFNGNIRAGLRYEF